MTISFSLIVYNGISFNPMLGFLPVVTAAVAKLLLGGVLFQFRLGFSTRRNQSTSSLTRPH